MTHMRQACAQLRNTERQRERKKRNTERDIER